MSALSESPAWQALADHFDTISALHMRELFAADSKRFKQFSLRVDELLLDYSKNRITTETIQLLVELAEARGVAGWIERMFAGERINNTEDRAVLHVALRNRSNRPIRVNDVDVMPGVNAVLDRMREFTDAVREGVWGGYTGKSITDVVNIGIGGSDLGPRMVCKALTPYGHPRLTMHFVANVDGTDITEVLKRCDPETTLFVIASKTFTTQETLANAYAARDWFVTAAGSDKDVRKHFVAVSTNKKGVEAFGIDAANMFEFWDWVGGRYSVWSAIGLPVALFIGMESFEELLTGAHLVDEHFRQAPFAENMPVIMALLGVWYIDFFDAHTHAVLPYDQYLELFPAYLMQADMESNGKSVTRDGERVDYATAPVLWGQPGTNGQHAFYQLLHQGTRLVPADFILPRETHNPVGEQHALLAANCFAQTEALMHGRTEAETRADLERTELTKSEIEALLPHKVFDGNRPTNTLLIDKITPQNLGALVALYEHKIFVQGVIWGLDSFDQWGVELGKLLAKRVREGIDGDDGAFDASTKGLIRAFRGAKKQGLS